MGLGPVVVEQQLEEPVCPPAATLASPVLTMVCFSVARSTLSHNMTILRDPASLFLIHVPAPLHSLMPSSKVSGLSLPLPGAETKSTPSL